MPLLSLFVVDGHRTEHREPGRTSVGRGGSADAELQAVFQVFTFPLRFSVGGRGFSEFCVVAIGWRHALQSEWPFIIIVIVIVIWSE